MTNFYPCRIGKILPLLQLNGTDEVFSGEQLLGANCAIFRMKIATGLVEWRAGAFENLWHMTHEFYEILMEYQAQVRLQRSCVLVTLVELEGSSYRKPGVRMLIAEGGEMTGAVSGGCVEKEILRQSAAVFETGEPLLMTYDGTFRLGCEGVLYLLIEPVKMGAEDVEFLLGRLDGRVGLEVATSYTRAIGRQTGAGSVVRVEGREILVGDVVDRRRGELVTQKLPPVFELFIFGAEHDSVVLADFAARLGWRITVVAPPDEQKSLGYFSGARELLTPLFSEVNALDVHEDSAVILMTHSISKDTQYLVELRNKRPAYFGLLGPAHRREKLIDKLLEYAPDVEEEFIDLLRGPAGLHIGAASAQEIALSILSEILAVTRGADVMPLRDKKGRIHD